MINLAKLLKYSRLTPVYKEFFMKIMQIVGTRPNFMKAAPIIRELTRRNVDCIFVHTGQHFDENMSKVFFEDLDLPEPNVYLNAVSGSHSQQTASIMLKMEPIISSEAPDLVIVVGDVNSTIAAALCSVKMKVPVAHVEAGYRSGDMSMPEEINRIVVDHISQMLFAPTEDAVDNLVKEGVETERIFFVGNIMAETLIRFRDRAKESVILEYLNLIPKSYSLATIHRAENVDDTKRLESIMSALAESPMPTVLPLHPRTRGKIVGGPLSKYLRTGILITPPLGYLDFMKLLDNASLVLTDSGGVQEEALLLSIPCVTLRYNTERTITVKLGANRLVGAEKGLILDAIQNALSTDRKGIPRPAFWDDCVAQRIIDAIFSNQHMLAIEPPRFLNYQLAV